MNRFVTKLSDFKFKVNESDGFGTSQFLRKKESDIYHYFFNLDKENGGTEAYHLIIGKYSDREVIEGPKNSYCVLTINEISPEIREDIAAEKEDIPGMNSQKFKMGSGELSRTMKYVYKCVNDYLQINPKIIRIYDEIQDNLIYDGKGTYLEYMKSISLSELGLNWSVQEGSSKMTLIISR
jgi:hypothetical protein